MIPSSEERMRNGMKHAAGVNFLIEREQILDNGISDERRPTGLEELKLVDRVHG